MPLSRDEIYKKVQAVLVDALGVDEEEVTPNASLRDDLGAESIDFLDIVFRIEKAFTADPTKPFKIPRGELFPENIQQLMSDEKYVKGDAITPEGVAELKARMPYADYTEFDASPTVENAGKLVTVNMIVNYLESKLKD
jgi:acyl carrier protein